MNSFDWILAAICTACGAALISLSLSLLIIPAGFVHSRFTRIAAIAALVVGLGTCARAVGAGLSDIGGWTGVMFRVNYLAWAVAAVVGPAAVRTLDSRFSYAIVVGMPAWGILFAAFVFTPAFVEPASAPFELSDLGLRWAFIGLVAVIVTSAAITAVRLSGLAVVTSQRITREVGLAISFGYLLLASLVMVQAVGDIGLFGWESRYGLATVITLGWMTSTISIQRAICRDMERTLRHLRNDLDTQSFLSLRDSLTGLFNRGYFFESLHQAMEQLKRNGEPFAVCIADLDDFKKINDRYGHPMGDMVLQSVAKVLMRTCRPYDTAARYGGEEFIILLRNVSKNGASTIAERLRKAVMDLEFTTNDGLIGVTITMGVVSVTKPRDISAIIREADEALYEGKNKGKNQVRIRSWEVD